MPFYASVNITAPAIIVVVVVEFAKKVKQAS
jgi:hypothetical protein